MTSDHWHPVSDRPDVHYVTKEGFPGGIIVLKSGDLALNDFTFRDGTIDFDMKPLAEDIPGIRFRQRDPQNGEEFYIRSLPDCRAENDCVQYSPVINGFLLWNVYPQYQTHAPVAPNGWNHVRLVVSGKRMNVFINDSIQPTLSVGELLGNTQAGGLELHGPAAFANLTVTPGKTDGLSPAPLPDGIGNARGIVHDWSLGPLTPLHYGSAPTHAERPRDPTAWKRLHSERFGILNLNRQFHASEEPAALTWVMTSIDSDQDQIKQVSLAWLGQAWIFVNGALVTSGKNFYYPDSERRFPDGRLSLQNGSFPVPLHLGHNEIVIALYDSVHDDGSSRTKYGWGLAMRYDDVRGLSVPRQDISRTNGGAGSLPAHPFTRKQQNDLNKQLIDVGFGQWSRLHQEPGNRWVRSGSRRAARNRPPQKNRQLVCHVCSKPESQQRIQPHGRNS